MLKWLLVCRRFQRHHACSAGEPLHIEEPFMGKRLADMRLLLHAIYRCTMGSAAVLSTVICAA